VRKSERLRSDLALFLRQLRLGYVVFGGKNYLWEEDSISGNEKLDRRARECTRMSNKIHVNKSVHYTKNYPTLFFVLFSKFLRDKRFWVNRIRI
jgi:hypothetical protein